MFFNTSLKKIYLKPECLSEKKPVISNLSHKFLKIYLASCQNFQKKVSHFTFFELFSKSDKKRCSAMKTENSINVAIIICPNKIFCSIFLVFALVNSKNFLEKIEIKKILVFECNFVSVNNEIWAIDQCHVAKEGDVEWSFYFHCTSNDPNDLPYANWYFNSTNCSGLLHSVRIYNVTAKGT
ncbi:hypothetical protein RFI_36106 [Reticulomyxa filosa]|uniref:Uncharacterized protein n=1 Tax=Reticulomyxa filosa TaxID=46433 RepID=X6LJL4_RETFI|nr:hypothetical protein RFI_36106 [Reticulomyxa filosa]|eukprot:ETO01332.1 hypothetical protein RFI_36106 [Reticulomyxa filosa]